MPRIFRHGLLLVIICALCFAGGTVCRGQSEVVPFQGRQIESVEIVLEGLPRRVEGIEKSLLEFVRVAPNAEYNVARVRESLLALYDSDRVTDARVEVGEAAGKRLRVRFIVRLQPRVAEVVIDLDAPPGTGVTEDELRARLNLLEPGARVTESALRVRAG